MSKEIIHSFDEKIQAVNLYKKRRSKAEVARFLGLCPSLIDLWVRQYYIGGPSALTPKSTGATYDPRTRIAIVEDLLNKAVSLRDASALFGVSSRTLGRWLRSVEESGFTSLFDRIPSNSVPGMGRKRKEAPQTELALVTISCGTSTVAGCSSIWWTCPALKAVTRLKTSKP